ncbi:coiled-coil domain-containing protein 50-like isoform X1, partial [Clarias magur]
MTYVIIKGMAGRSDMFPSTCHVSVEQFYSSNMQKNQAVQNDVCLARRLQDNEEEERLRLTHQLQQLEEEDCEYARMIQEELRRSDEEAQRREEGDE